MMADKRDQCGCHRECTMLPHPCVKPCVWPNCLTNEEHADLAVELEADCLGDAS